MKYVGFERGFKVGDSVLVEDGVEGVVVCDFDGSQFFPGFEDWSPGASVVKDSVPNKGVLIESRRYGLIHYENEDDSIKFI
ncbi:MULTISPECIES: hypothetical protein [Burkholderia]|uniref:hypothetical protein n=1 Tax=Burkholderia TaxID=32008 RepID=UPI0011782F35|nr:MULTISPECIES: hypothetical protein [Burkholderia]EKS9795043.1 hypothetical protein [Burkholderia cepacia]EKS9801004.1 hypothetical protein [Burkholderia cepacia]EKS9810045.1 hypothetical protein [Burkholderia cepacia]EKS9817433.1 hypothetical protein [Burkholderia cepacia]EKS9825446.1 hypothetical protein [Burkholderia cepacia]